MKVENGFKIAEKEEDFNEYEICNINRNINTNSIYYPNDIAVVPWGKDSRYLTNIYCTGPLLVKVIISRVEALNKLANLVNYE